MKRLTLSEFREVLPEESDMKAIVDETCQMFDFGQEVEIDNDADLIADLWHRKLLRPPFDRCVFTFSRNRFRLYLCAAYGVKVAQPEGDVDDVTVIVVVTQHEPKDGDDAWAADVVGWFKATGETNIMLGGAALSECEGETTESFRNFTSWCIGRFMRLCMLLNTKGVPQRHEPVPRKLNAKRARQGKPALSAVTYVNLTRLNAHSANGEGGHKATHWRRGHIRRYDDGSVTWVRDCIVNADGDLKQRERYQVGVKS